MAQTQGGMSGRASRTRREQPRSDGFLIPLLLDGNCLPCYASVGPDARSGPVNWLPDGLLLLEADQHAVCAERKLKPLPARRQSQGHALVVAQIDIAAALPANRPAF